MHALVLAATLEATPLARARADEEAMRFPEALAGYASIARDVPAARARVAWLEERRGGDFAPLRALETVRRSAARSSSAADVDALVRQADTFPPGVVRIEARMFAATAYLDRLGRPARGRELLRIVADDPDVEGAPRARALGLLVRSEVAEGRLAEARADLARFGDRVPADARAVVVARTRRFVASVAACLALLGVVLGLGAALVRARAARRRAVDRVRELTGVLAAGCAAVALGGAIAAAYDGTARVAVPFVVLAVALGPLVVMARAWSAVGAATPRARVGRALACGAAGLGLALLILERVDPSYLEGFGL